MFAVSAFEVAYQAGEHFGDFLVFRVDVAAFGFEKVLARAGDDELRPNLTCRPTGSVQVLREVTVGRLLKSFRDQ